MSGIILAKSKFEVVVGSITMYSKECNLLLKIWIQLRSSLFNHIVELGAPRHLDAKSIMEDIR